VVPRPSRFGFAVAGRAEGLRPAAAGVMVSRIPRTRSVFSIAVAAFAIAATVAIFQPLEIAVANRAELGADLGQLLAWLAWPFAALWLGLAAVAMLLTMGISTRAVSLLVAMIIGLWVQGTFFVWDYGVFDGTPIDWSRNTGKGVVEASFWLALFAIALARPGWFAGRATWLAAISVGLQTVSLAGAFHLATPLDRYEPSASQQTSDSDSRNGRVHEAFLRYSQTRNVLVIVLDTFQSDFFSELLQDPSFAAELPPGLHYYRNAISPYSSTARSLPSILTSSTPDRHRGPRWMAERMQTSLPAQLVDRGWEATLLSPTPHYLSCNQGEFSFGCISHVAFLASMESGGAFLAARAQEIREDARTVFRAAVFRLSPHFVKRQLYSGGIWHVPDPWGEGAELAAADPRIAEATRRDLAVLDAVTRGAKAIGAVPSFKFIHLFGSHHPSSVADDCTWNHKEVPTSVEGVFRSAYWERDLAISTSGCIISRTFEFLRRLDDIGVYDDSLVFIVGDHGRRFSPVDPSLANPPVPGVDAAAEPNRSESASGDELEQPTKGVPLFLVKPIGARGALRISDVPVSLCDIPSTVISSLEYGVGFACESIFEFSGERAPRFHFREGSLASKGGERRLWYSRYRVEGHSWLDASWQRVPIGRAVNGITDRASPVPRSEVD